MNRKLLFDLKWLKAKYELEISKLDKEIVCEPDKEALNVLVEFNDFLVRTQGKAGARTTPEAIALIESLGKRKKAAELKKKSWNYDTIVNEKLDYHAALGEIDKLIYYAEKK